MLTFLRDISRKRSFLRKRMKILLGAYSTYIRGNRRPYEPDTWWDNKFFTQGLSDRQTIGPDKNLLSAKYHYDSVELLILRYLRNNGRNLTSSTICDLGSGSGHWIDFYLSLGASHCLGIDVSKNSVDFLRSKYREGQGVTIEHGRIHEVLARTELKCDLVNAVGVMFHLVDDEEWEETVRQVGRVLRAGGIFVVGGHFGLLDGLNVELDSEGAVIKRLRSASHWKRSLKQAGFARARIYRNSAYRYIRDSLPENNVLIAEKSG
jgi:SAM-dependent methyltransferase